MRWINTGSQEYKEKRKESTKLRKQKNNEQLNQLMKKQKTCNKNNSKLYQSIRRQNIKTWTENIGEEEWKKYFNRMMKASEEMQEKRINERENTLVIKEIEMPSKKECD